MGNGFNNADTLIVGAGLSRGAQVGSLARLRRRVVSARAVFMLLMGPVQPMPPPRYSCRHFLCAPLYFVCAHVTRTRGHAIAHHVNDSDFVGSLLK